MAENRESTILDVQLDAGKVAQDLQDLVTRIAALKAQQKQVQVQQVSSQAVRTKRHLWRPVLSRR